MILKGIIKKRIGATKNFNCYLKKYRHGFFAIIVSNLMILGISVVMPYLYKILLDDVMIRREYALLKSVILGYIGLFCMETLILLALRILNNNLYNDLMFVIRTDIWGKISRMNFADFEEYQHADLKQRIDSDVDAVEVLISQQMIEYAFLWLYIVVVGVLLLKTHVILGLASFIVIPAGNWISGLTNKGIWQSSDAIRNIWGQYESYLRNSIEGWKDIKALNAEKRVVRKFTGFWHKFSRNFFKMQLYILGSKTLLAVKDILITKMSIYFIGAIFVLNGELTVGSLLVFGNYFDLFNGKLNGIIYLDNMFNNILPSIQRVIEILGKEENPAEDREHEEECLKIHEDANIFSGAVELRDVCFKYKNAGSSALDKVSLKIDPGDCVAIVGRNGCGKSTLIKLILGLYKPDEGEITFDGNDTVHMDPVCLNSNIGVVMQDSILFNLSIRENLLLAKPDASEDEIIEVCRQAFAEEFIIKLPEGLETVIGEKGALLSGGQRQRLTIARTLLKNPKIVIFDEATSALDYESEKMINQAVGNLLKQKTIILIAHRLSSILMSDKVVVMDNGGIEAIGKHDELYQNCETYISLFKEQYSQIA